jgi:DNA-binding MarR family transcriptional regulator
VSAADGCLFPLPKLEKPRKTSSKLYNMAKIAQSKKWNRPEDDSKTMLFVHSALDEYGLDVYEFRVLAHVARRDGKSTKGAGRGCFAKQRNIADACGISHRKAQGVLGILYAAGLLEKETQKGSTNIYRVAPPSRWKEPGELTKIRRQRKDAEDVNPLGKIENAELTNIATAS